MIKYRLLALTLFIATISFAGIGLSDWTANTPGGNNINNFSGMALYLKNGQKVQGVSEWYFYKSFIIGKQSNWSPYGNTVGYFIVNEVTNKIDTFTNASSWTKAIEQNKLQPMLWTRWFTHDWTSFNGRLGYVFLLGFHIVIPSIILFCIVLYRAFLKEGFNRRKPYTIISLVVFGLIFMVWLSGAFPQSW
jgi:hypothetical protein